MTDEAHAEEASKELNVLIEEQAPVEEAPVAEPEVNPLQAELDAANQKLADQTSLYEDLKSQTSMPEEMNLSELIAEPEVSPEPQNELDFGDIYQDPEGFQKNLQSYLRSHDDDVAQKAVEKVMTSAEMVALQNSHWGNEHNRALDKSKEVFGERFNYDQEIVAMQQKLAGLSVQDAHRIRDYDKLLKEVQQNEAASAERANTAPSTTASPTRMVADTDEGKVTVKLTAGQKLAADKYMGGDYQRYAKSLHRQQTGGEMSK